LLQHIFLYLLFGFPDGFFEGLVAGLLAGLDEGLTLDLFEGAEVLLSFTLLFVPFFLILFSNHPELFCQSVL